MCILTKKWFKTFYLLGFSTTIGCGHNDIAIDNKQYINLHAIHQKHLETTPLQTSVANFIVLGDSISAGIGAVHKNIGYATLLYKNDNNTYPEAVHIDLQHYYNPALHVIDLAHSGDTSNDLIAHQLPALRNQTPLHGHTIVVITIGGNDFRHAMQPPHPTYQEALAHVIRNLQIIDNFFSDHEAFPDGVSIYLGNVYDVTDGEEAATLCFKGLILPGISSALHLWAEAYQAFAQTHTMFHLVDTLQLFHGHCFNYANPDNPYYQSHNAAFWLSERDCIHPNNQGHNALRWAFLESIQQTIIPLPQTR